MLQDIFVENIVKKKKSISLKLLQVLIILTSIVLALVLLTVGLLFLSGLAGVALLLACGVVYGAYILATSFNLEYETCFTNGALDVDTIINRRRRKRLISLKCKDIETMGRYKKVDHENKQYKTRIIACDSEDSEDVWYLTVRHSTLGHTLVVINVTDRMLEGFKAYIPRQLAFEIFNRR